MTTTEDGRDDACPLYSCCLTDQQWELIEPLLPVPRRGRPRLHPLRRVLDTIWYVLRTGCAWRLVPNDLVAWHAAYRCFRSWTAQGVWADIHDALRDQVRTAAGRDPNPTAAVLDSQTVQSSEGGEQIGWDQGKKTRGRKRHLLVDTNGLLLICYVHSAAVNDRTGAKLGDDAWCACAVFEIEAGEQPSMLARDMCSNRYRASARARKPQVPERAHRSQPVSFRGPYTRRSLGCWLDGWRSSAGVSNRDLIGPRRPGRPRYSSKEA